MQALHRHCANGIRARPACQHSVYAVHTTLQTTVNRALSTGRIHAAAQMIEASWAWPASAAASRRQLGIAQAAQTNDLEGLTEEQMMLSKAMTDLQSFMTSMPELSEQQLAMLLDSKPGLVARPVAEVRGFLDGLASMLRVPFASAVRLLSRHPSIWDRPLEAAAGKVQQLAAALGTGADEALGLYCSQPILWSINHPSIIKDRLDSLALRLAIPLPTVVKLIGRQPLIWVIQPSTVAITVTQLSERLGMTYPQALELVTLMPVALMLESRLLQFSMQGFCALSGLSESVALELMVRCVGLVHVPCEVLASSLEQLAADLQVSQESVVDLVTQQPLLLCAQPSTIAAALEVVRAVLLLDQAQALAVLARQPALLYDFTVESLMGRVESLAATLGKTQAEARDLAQQQPALLTLAPATLRSTLSAVGMRTGASLADCISMLVEDPGSYVLMGYSDDVISAWSERLQLDPQSVLQLLQSQPALLDITANTVKARLETLAALFGVPLEIAVQLALKHAALAAVPPNATITRVKNLSTALQMSMQSAGTLMAKEASLLALAAHNASALRSATAGLEEIVAIYEYYTMDWLQRQAKELQPARTRSFSSLHS